MLRKNIYNLFCLMAGNIIILVGLLLIFFLAFESYYRFWYDESDSFAMTRVSKRWLARYYKMNNFDSRDNLDYSKVKMPGKRRVTFVGDSFTAGHGIKDVDQRFVNIIRHKKKDWETHALAINGIDTSSEISYVIQATDFGYELEDVVLVYCLNDIGDITEEWKRVEKRINNMKSDNYLVKHSYFINAIYYRLRVFSDPDVSQYFNFLNSSYEGKSWHAQKQRLRQFEKIVRERGGKFYVVIFPFLHSINPEYPFHEVHRQIGSFLASIDVPYLDLLPYLEKYKPSQLTVNKYDAHPNEFAHKIVVEQILNFLKQGD